MSHFSTPVCPAASSPLPATSVRTADPGPLARPVIPDGPTEGGLPGASGPPGSQGCAGPTVSTCGLDTWGRGGRSFSSGLTELLSALLVRTRPPLSDPFLRGPGSAAYSLGAQSPALPSGRSPPPQHLPARLPLRVTVGLESSPRLRTWREPCTVVASSVRAWGWVPRGGPEETAPHESSVAERSRRPGCELTLTTSSRENWEPCATMWPFTAIRAQPS